jgi:hypothetical protein
LNSLNFIDDFEPVSLLDNWEISQQWAAVYLKQNALVIFSRLTQTLAIFDVGEMKLRKEINNFQDNKKARNWGAVSRV